jgi:hypothetical protein
MRTIVELLNQQAKRMNIFDYCLGRSYLTGQSIRSKSGIKDLNIFRGTRSPSDIIIIDNKEEGCFPSY